MAEELVNPAGKLIDLRRRLGVPVGLLYLLHRAFLRTTGGTMDLQLHRLLVQPVRGRDILPAHLAGSVVVRQVVPDDPTIAESLSRADDLPQRLQRGDVCIAAFRGGRIVGHLWLCFGPFEEVECGCLFMLPAGKGAWDYDVFVAPEERGGPVFPALWDAAWGLLRDRGVLWTASRVSAFNDVSLRSHLRLGARPVGWLLLTRFGRCVALAGSVRPRLRVNCGTAGPIEVNFRTATV